MREIALTIHSECGSSDDFELVLIFSRDPQDPIFSTHCDSLMPACDDLLLYWHRKVRELSNRTSFVS